MKFTSLSLNTLVTQVPKVINDNFSAISNYMDIFYDSSRGIIIKPINTTGRIKGTTAQFVNVITDNMTVKKQFTNLYENYTTVDYDFVVAYNAADISTRVWNGDACTNSIWPFEPSAYSWIDVQTPNLKLNNDVSYGLQNSVLGQEVRIIFDLSNNNATRDYAILLDVSAGGWETLTVGIDSSTWMKLITVAYDASYGSKWIVKEYGGTYIIS